MLHLVEGRQREIEDYLDVLSRSLNRFDNRSNISVSDALVLESRLEHIQTLVRSFAIEVSSIKNRKQARLYRAKSKEFNTHLKQLSKDVKWMSMHAKQQTSRKKSGEYDEIEMNDILKDEDKAIQYGQKLQIKNENIADEVIRNVEEMKEIAVETAIKLNDQTEQIANADQGLAHADDEMERAKRTLRRMSRRVMTDKYVNCMLILVLITIIIIVVLHFFDVTAYIKQIPI
eukprot:79535_1